MITYQVTPFVNNVTFFKSFFAFNVGWFTAIKKASKFFLLGLFIGADIDFPIEKHDLGVERDAWLFLNLFSHFLAHSDEY